jgi:hypothetical protein
MIGINPNSRGNIPRITFILLTTAVFISGCSTAVFAADLSESEDTEIFLTIPYSGKTIAEYRVFPVPLERIGDEYDAQLPDSDNWLICDEEYVVFYYEIIQLKKGYLPPVSIAGMQLFYASGEAVNPIPSEKVSFRLNEELPENEGLIFFPVPEIGGPLKAARFSYSIREEVPKIYGGSKSVRILEMGETTIEIDKDDTK